MHAEIGQINRIVNEFYTVFDNRKGSPELGRIYAISAPEFTIFNTSWTQPMALKPFVDERQKWLTDGTITDFFEHELDHETRIYADFAIRFSRFEKSGKYKGQFFHEFGHKCLKLVRIQDQWKILSVVWRDASHESAFSFDSGVRFSG